MLNKDPECKVASLGKKPFQILLQSIVLPVEGLGYSGALFFFGAHYSPSTVVLERSSWKEQDHSLKLQLGDP